MPGVRRRRGLFCRRARLQCRCGSDWAADDRQRREQAGFAHPAAAPGICPCRRLAAWPAARAIGPPYGRAGARGANWRQCLDRRPRLGGGGSQHWRGHHHWQWCRDRRRSPHRQQDTASAGVVIYPAATLGDRVVVHAGAVLGAELPRLRLSARKRVPPHRGVVAIEMRRQFAPQEPPQP